MVQGHPSGEVTTKFPWSQEEGRVHQFAGRVSRLWDDPREQAARADGLFDRFKQRTLQIIEVADEIVLIYAERKLPGLQVRMDGGNGQLSGGGLQHLQSNARVVDGSHDPAVPCKPDGILANAAREIQSPAWGRGRPVDKFQKWIRLAIAALTLPVSVVPTVTQTNMLA